MAVQSNVNSAFQRRSNSRTGKVNCLILRRAAKDRCDDCAKEMAGKKPFTQSRIAIRREVRGSWSMARSVSVRFSAREIGLLFGVADDSSSILGRIKRGGGTGKLVGLTSGPTDSGIKSLKKTEAFEFSIEAEIASGLRTVVTVLFLAVSAGPSIARRAPNS